MARKPTETQMEEHIVTDADTPGLPAVIAETNAVAAADMVIMGSFDAIQALGRIQAAQFFTTVGEKLIAETALSLKESKKFKGLPYQDQDGNLRHVGNFQEFCEAFLGKSYSRVMELISNYHLLGAELYEQAEAIGLRQRDYNAIKALPADDQVLIKQALAEESKDRVLEVLQDMAVKHAKEKEELRTARETAEKDLESARDLSASKQERINALQDEIDGLHGRRKRMTTDEKLKDAQATAHSRALEVEVCVLSLGAALRDLRAIAQETGRDQTAVMAGLVGQGMAHLMDLRDLLQLPEVSAGPPAPWMQGNTPHPSPLPEGEGA